ncbi:NTP/NDP exchange transporter [Peristeroidobacter soli]|jgi:AAA family ATP:ADP antiporter|uniref:NTP/NDP exchange transporter n=1 Tax=Peristeroidobacter soli TaxID=2497877 RepID=UPI00101DF3B7|nr:MFS transporter [Peristeroidobacter soli]
MNTPAHPPPSPFGRFLSRLAPIQPAETGAVVAAFFLFFFMWSGYFSVRPVRETIGTIIGRDKLADIWIVTSIVSILIIPVYGEVVARFRRSVFLPAAYGIVAIVLVITGLSLRGDEINMNAGKFFYVFISVVNLFLLSVFWSFLLELFDRNQTKRLFGVIAAGGSAGALMGPFISDLAVPHIGNSGVLFFGAALFVAAIFCQRILLNVWSGRTDATNKADDRPIGGNPFAGVTIILRSPYVLGIALFVVGISCVNTLLYFEQLRLVEEHFPDLKNRTQIFARFDWVVQALTVASQIFLTGRIAEKFGVKALITFVPVIMVFAFAGLALSGSFAVLTMVVIGRRAMEYAFVRPGREMLWSPLDKETKYKAKNTVDVPVYRGADALSAQLNNWVAGAGFGIAAVAWLGAAVAALWGLLGYWLGRRFEDKEKLQVEAAPVAQR